MPIILKLVPLSFNPVVDSIKIQACTPTSFTVGDSFTKWFYHRMYEEQRLTSRLQKSHVTYSKKACFCAFLTSCTLLRKTELRLASKKYMIGDLMTSGEWLNNSSPSNIAVFTVFYYQVVALYSQLWCRKMVFQKVSIGELILSSVSTDGIYVYWRWKVLVWAMIQVAWGKNNCLQELLRSRRHVRYYSLTGGLSPINSAFPCWYDHHATLKRKKI